MKDPAFLFYYEAFTNGTRFMSLEAKGAYIDALCYQADQGSIPEKHMLIICQRQHEVMSEILTKFVRDDAGNFFNERLRIETEKRRKYSESRANNRKGTKKDDEHMNNISKTYEKHMVNKDIDTITDNNVIGIKGVQGEKEKFDLKTISQYSIQAFLESQGMKHKVTFERICEAWHEWALINQEAIEDITHAKRSFTLWAQGQKLQETTPMSNMKRSYLAGQKAKENIRKMYENEQRNNDTNP